MLHRVEETTEVTALLDVGANFYETRLGDPERVFEAPIAEQGFWPHVVPHNTVEGPGMVELPAF